jgi:hypothetical protein
MNDKPVATPLPYARPIHAGELDIVRHAETEMRIDLGPLPTSLFIATVMPWALLTGFLLGFLAWTSARHGGFWRDLLSVSGALVPAVSALVMWSKYRHHPRVVGVAEGQVFYSDARTRGQPMGIRPAEVTALRVYRSWWRPWIFELTTVPAPKWLGISATSPVVLLIGFDWRALDRIRWELSVALGLETTTRSPDAATQ